MWRPTEYKEEYIDKVAEYLSTCVDGERKFIKTEWDKSTWYERVKIVKLPTIVGFALYLWVVEKTVYRWAEKNKPFRQSLDIIKEEQRKRLLNKWLSWEYNSTIAKLILSANHWISETSRLEHSWKDWGPIEYKDEMSFRELEELRQSLIKRWKKE